jgi:site-specific recombinase XerD
MGSEIVVIGAGLPGLAQDLARKAEGYAAASKAANTRKAYKSDWTAFEGWCDDHGLAAMPPDPNVVLAYLVDNAGRLKVSTLQRHLISIREGYRRVDQTLDTSGSAFRDVWRGIRRTHGTPSEGKAALMTGHLRRAVGTLPDTLAGRRDRALLLVGFAAALRRVELASLEVCASFGANWIEIVPDGLKIHLGATKTDQEGEGDVVGVPYGTHVETCPVRSYIAWALAAGITAGPAFRAIDRHGHMSDHALTDKAVTIIVKRAIVAAEKITGATQAEADRTAERFAGHSLRAGLATSASANDAPASAIQRQLRHKKFDTTMRYIRDGQIFKKNAAGMAGL